MSKGDSTRSIGAPCSGILWSCIARGGMIIAEAGEDNTADGSITRVAQQIMAKPDTAGWEFHSDRRGGKLNLKSIKFHAYTKDASTEELTTWKFACVFDSTVERDQAQSFLEKIVILTESFRQSDFDWQYGGVLAVQESFAPVLMQRMQEVSYLGRVAMVNEKVDEAKAVMANNIELILEREGKLDKLSEKASMLDHASHAFKKKAKKVKRFQMWQSAKHGLAVGAAITAGVTVVTVPPLIALL